MMVIAPRKALRRRFIAEDDLPAVADLLSRGFPARSLPSWRRGLERMRARSVPDGAPRFGVMLDVDGRPVGVLLMICSLATASDGRKVQRCNLSSWHTEPDYSPHAPLLLGAALRANDVTFINISPAPQTQPIIEAQGFCAFVRGSLLTLPALSARVSPARAVPLAAGDVVVFPEADLLREHIGFGCPSFAVERDGAREPFVFARPRRLRAGLWGAQLLFCRSLDAYAVCGAALGRALLRRGVPAVLVDTEANVPGMVGRRINAGQNRYVFGPHPPPPGDLAYTELAIFDD